MSQLVDLETPEHFTWDTHFPELGLSDAIRDLFKTSYPTVESRVTPDKHLLVATIFGVLDCLHAFGVPDQINERLKTMGMREVWGRCRSRSTPLDFSATWVLARRSWNLSPNNWKQISHMASLYHEESIIILPTATYRRFSWISISFCQQNRVGLLL
ncbi:hypothetical protein MVEN_00749700 [Mycena venus]|uniref:Uncharacterized protein n=1 Tax=Mycena venus TaxID=2733690 RepID=A0A8H6YJM7_9AGAR|nr:hypothetical protein MVEN_00749700 [Mycena venus]